MYCYQTLLKWNELVLIPLKNLIDLAAGRVQYPVKCIFNIFIESYTNAWKIVEVCIVAVISHFYGNNEFFYGLHELVYRSKFMSIHIPLAS